MDGMKICRVGQTAEIRRAFPDADFIDAKGGVIMPAFINTHEHIYSAMARGLNINGYAPKGFLDYHGVGETIGIRLNPEDIHIMHKSEYSGMFGDYSSYSAEYDELTEDAGDEEE